MSKLPDVVALAARVAELEEQLSQAEKEAKDALLRGHKADCDRLSRLQMELRVARAALAEARQLDQAARMKRLRRELASLEAEIQAAYNQHGEAQKAAAEAEAVLLQAQQRAADAWRRVEDLERRRDRLERELAQLEAGQPAEERSGVAAGSEGRWAA